jgi:hypothetical protein
MAIAAPPMAINVIQRILLESQPLLNSPIILSSVDILMIKNNNGTAATPFNTAAYTNALTGSTPIKLSSRPTTVAAMMIT